MKVFRPRERGFTLIELLVTIGIMAILAAVVVPNVGKFVGSGKTQSAASELQAVQAAMDAAMADKDWTAVLAQAGPITDFSSAGGGDIDASAATLYLYPDYLRLKSAGSGRTYSWNGTGLLTQTVP